MAEFYIDLHDNVISFDDWLKIMTLHEADRTVAVTNYEILGLTVSTVWLGMGPSSLYETMIFGNGYDEHMRTSDERAVFRWSTREEARLEHEKICADIISGNFAKYERKTA